MAPDRRASHRVTRSGKKFRADPRNVVQIESVRQLHVKVVRLPKLEPFYIGVERLQLPQAPPPRTLPPAVYVRSIPERSPIPPVRWLRTDFSSPTEESVAEHNRHCDAAESSDDEELFRNAVFRDK